MRSQAVKGRTQALVSLLRERSRLLILTHTNPDPDSLASALGLQLLARERAGLGSSIAIAFETLNCAAVQNETWFRYHSW